MCPTATATVNMRWVRGVSGSVDHVSRRRSRVSETCARRVSEEWRGMARHGAAWRGSRAGGGDNTLLLFYVLLLLRAEIKAGGTWHELASSSLNYLYKLGVSFTELLAWHWEQHTPHKLSSEHKYLPEYFSDNPTTRRRHGRQRRYQLCLLLL